MPAALVLYHFLYPDDVISARLLTELAAGLAGRGWSVKAVCCNRACHDEATVYEPASEYEGVRIRRLWRPRVRQGSGIGRLLNAAWMLGAWALYALRDSFKPDVVIIGTDPPLSVLLAPVVKRIWPSAKVAHWCFDLYPEAAVADGLLGAGNPCVRALRRVLEAAYGACDFIADIGPCMRELVARYGSPARTATLVPWALVEPSRVLPVSRDDRQALFGDAPLALLYSGSLGRAHSVEPVLALARTLRSYGPRFAFTVRGNCEDRLRARITAGDSNVTLGSFALPGQLHRRLAAPDIHVVTLREGWTGTVVPSKFFGALAVGRPVLFVGSPKSAIAQWIREYDLGWTLDDTNTGEIAEKLLRLAYSPAALEALCARCHAVYWSEFSKSVTLAKWDTELRVLVGLPAPEPLPLPRPPVPAPLLDTPA